MNHYVSLSLTNRKSSVHLHALYSPRTALRTFAPRSDRLVICGQYPRNRLGQAGTVAVNLTRLSSTYFLFANVDVVLQGYVDGDTMFVRNVGIHIR